MLKHCVWHNVSAYLLHKYLVRYTSLSLQRTTGPDIVHAYQFTHYRRLVFGCFHRSVFGCLHRTSAGWTPSGANVTSCWRIKMVEISPRLLTSKVCVICRCADTHSSRRFTEGITQDLKSSSIVQLSLAFLMTLQPLFRGCNRYRST